jgi:hypothetical protein
MWAVEVLRAAANETSPGEPPALKPAHAIDAAVDHAGTYRDRQGNELVFVARDERLFLLHEGKRVPVETLAVPGLLARHPSFERHPMNFSRPQGRDTGACSEVTHGGRCYARDASTLPNEAEPAEWRALLGHYHHDSPWFGTLYVVARKGRLWAITGSGFEFPLEAVDRRTFRLADTPASGDWIRFGDVCNGRAAWLSLSGEPFVRVAEA